MSTPGSESYSPYPMSSSEITSPVPMASPLITQQRSTIVRQSTPRTPGKTTETSQSTDGDQKLKNFFQSLLVNKGK